MEHHLEHGKNLVHTMRAPGYPKSGECPASWIDEPAPGQREGGLAIGSRGERVSPEEELQAVAELGGRDGTARGSPQAPDGARRARRDFGDSEKGPGHRPEPADEQGESPAGGFSEGQAEAQGAARRRGYGEERLRMRGQRGERARGREGVHRPRGGGRSPQGQWRSLRLPAAAAGGQRRPGIKVGEWAVRKITRGGAWSPARPGRGADTARMRARSPRRPRIPAWARGAGVSTRRVEDINNKIKLTVRMGYGFRSIDNLIAPVMLRCSNLSITLPGRAQAA